MSLYRWTGPQTAIEIRVPGQEPPPVSRVVSNGDALDLPDDHADVRGWLAYGMISPVPAPPATKPVSRKDESNG